MPVQKRTRASTSPIRSRGQAPVSQPKPTARLAAVVPLTPRIRPLQVVVPLESVRDGECYRARALDGEEIFVYPGTVHPVVLAGVAARQESLLVQEESGRLVALGALRTQPTPGIDRADEYVIEASRVKIVVDTDIALVAGAAEIAIRAVGFVETIARNITARAAGVHKIVGRIIHLN